MFLLFFPLPRYSQVSIFSTIIWFFPLNYEPQLSLKFISSLYNAKVYPILTLYRTILHLNNLPNYTLSKYTTKLYPISKNYGFIVSHTIRSKQYLHVEYSTGGVINCPSRNFLEKNTFRKKVVSQCRK